jgi:hypothetical protein
MRRFIIKFIFFTLPVWAALFFEEALLRNIPNDYSYKKEYLDNYSTEVETLVLGSSHSYYGINPDFFTSSTFNASHVSQTLKYDYEILKKFQNNFDSLKTIILPVSYFTLFAKLEEGSESWRIKNYVIYYGINVALSIDDYSEFLSNNPKVNCKRLSSYYISGSGELTCSKLGWGTGYKSENAKNLLETGKTASKRHTKENIYSEKNTNNFIENNSILLSIINLCNKRNIKLLLFTPPAFETYRQNIDPEQYEVTVKVANSVDKQYDNCIYINLFDDASFVEKDFYDADHLSEIGAEKLSKLINKKINEWQ